MPGTRFPEYANDFNKSDFLQVLLALQGKVNRELHVAMLCVVDGYSDNHDSYRCYAFPKGKGKDAAIINAICLRSFDRSTIDNAFEDEKKPLAIVIFTDMDSYANYDYISTNKKYEATVSESTLHSLNNAIIVYLGDTVDGTPIETYYPEEIHQNATSR